MPRTSSTAITVRFRGVRGSIPSTALEMSRYGGNTSCVEVRCGEQLLILDAGTGIRSLGEELSKAFGADPINADLLVSHTHWDHIQGLPFFAPVYSPSNRIRILGANTRGAMLERALKNQMSPMHFPIGFHQMKGLAGVEEIVSDHIRLGHFSVDVAHLNHPGGCAGFRVEVNGISLAYLPDHEPYQNTASTASDASRKRLTDFVRDVDLLILDTQYTEAEYQHRVGWGHGCLPESVALALEADVRRLALFHHDPSHDDHEIDRMVEAAQNLAGPSPLLVQGSAENGTIILEAEISAAVELTRPDSVRVAAV